MTLISISCTYYVCIYRCAVGKHSQVNIGATISASPNATAPSTSTTASSNTPALKSISDYNATNPDATSAASSATKIITATRKSSRNTDGITAKCQRKGCQKTFILTENTPQACTYHIGQPIFHDAVKFWSCCAYKKCFDFDEFMSVPGCGVGCHDDGVIDLGE